MIIAPQTETKLAYRNPQWDLAIKTILKLKFTLAELDYQNHSHLKHSFYQYCDLGCECKMNHCKPSVYLHNMYKCGLHAGFRINCP